MNKFRIDGALLAVALAGALSLRLSSGSFEWLTSVAGLCLLLVLFAFDEGYRSAFQSLAYASVAAFCAAIAAQLPFTLLAPNPDPHENQIRLTFTWGFACVLFWAIDRARMGGRVEATDVAPVRPTARRSFVPVAPPMEESAPPPIPPQTAAVETFASETARVETVTEPIPAGKEATVYLSLLGEGIPCLRSVKAEHLGRDFYRIAEAMPEGESWEYTPGQVVRAKKRNLSNGKALVAFEEAPRA